MFEETNMHIAHVKSTIITMEQIQIHRITRAHGGIWCENSTIRFLALELELELELSYEYMFDFNREE